MAKPKGPSGGGGSEGGFGGKLDNFVRTSLKRFDDASQEVFKNLEKNLDALDKFFEKKFPTFSKAWKDAAKSMKAADGAMGKASTAAKGLGKAMHGNLLVTELVGSMWGAFLFKSLSKVSSFVSDKLSPNLEHLTGGLGKQDAAAERLAKSQQRLALVWERAHAEGTKLDDLTNSLTESVTDFANENEALVKVSGKLAGKLSELAWGLGLVASGISAILTVGGFKSMIDMLGLMSGHGGKAAGVLARLGKAFAWLSSKIIPTFFLGLQGIGKLLLLLISGPGAAILAVVGGLTLLAGWWVTSTQESQKFGKSLGETTKELKKGSQAARDMAAQVENLIDTYALQAKSAGMQTRINEALIAGDIKRAAALERQLKTMQQEVKIAEQRRQQEKQLEELSSTYGQHELLNLKVQMRQVETAERKHRESQEALQDLDIEAKLMEKVLAAQGRRGELEEHKNRMVERRLVAEQNELELAKQVAINQRKGLNVALELQEKSVAKVIELMDLDDKRAKADIAASKAAEEQARKSLELEKERARVSQEAAANAEIAVQRKARMEAEHDLVIADDNDDEAHINAMQRINKATKLEAKAHEQLNNLKKYGADLSGDNVVHAEHALKMTKATTKELEQQNKLEGRSARLKSMLVKAQTDLAGLAKSELQAKLAVEAAEDRLARARGRSPATTGSFDKAKRNFKTSFASELSKGLGEEGRERLAQMLSHAGQFATGRREKEALAKMERDFARSQLTAIQKAKQGKEGEIGKIQDSITGKTNQQTSALKQTRAELKGIVDEWKATDGMIKMSSDGVAIYVERLKEAASVASGMPMPVNAPNGSLTVNGNGQGTSTNQKPATNPAPPTWLVSGQKITGWYKNGNGDNIPLYE